MTELERLRVNKILTSEDLGSVTIGPAENTAREQMSAMMAQLQG